MAHPSSSISPGPVPRTGIEAVTLDTASESDSLRKKTLQAATTSVAEENVDDLLNITHDGKEEPVVDRKELWSYYLYYNGDNGVGPIGYTPTIFQGLATAAGYDPVAGRGSSCTAEGASGQCLVPFGSGEKSVTAVVLIANGLSFMIMTLLFTTIGSAADYGSFGRWLLLILTVICWGAQFGTMGLVGASTWKAAMALYMISFVTYGCTLVFYAAVFPRLARNTPAARDARHRRDTGQITEQQYDEEESLEKNHISNISTMHSNWGYLLTLCLNLSVLLPLANNKRVNNYTILLTNLYWVVLGLPWFFFQKSRPGPKVPKGYNYLTIGWAQLWRACKQIKRLPVTFIYLFAFFLLADGLNTTGTLVSIIQNINIEFSFLDLTYLGLTQAGTSIISTAGFWYIQKYYKLRTKPMFVVTNVATVMIPLWGMIGLWTNKIGFHNRWEFYFYNVFFGLFQAPYYAYSQTMMAELCPPGYEGMFFGLFGFSNRASSIIGPNVIQKIISDTNNNWSGFVFLFVLCFCASVVIWFGVDVEKGRADAVKWAVEQRAQEKARVVAGRGVDEGGHKID